MWSTLAQVNSADFVTETDGRCLVGNAYTGKLLALDGKGAASGANGSPSVRRVPCRNGGE